MTSLFALRAPCRRYCQHLSRAQRRAWFIQRATLTPRVDIGRHAVPYTVARQFSRVPMGVR